MKSRFTIDLDPQFDQKLTEISRQKGVSKAEVIRRALATYGFISGEAKPESGLKLSLTNGEDRVVKDLMIP